jgi:excisionase family DNA binding protein
MDQLIEAREAARLLGISRRRAYLLGRLGVIPVVRLGERQVRFSATALHQWIAAGGKARDLADAPAPQQPQPEMAS